MDHIPSPTSPAHPILKIPYICKDQYYDGGTFLEFPERQGVDLEELFGRPASAEACREIEQFLQRWLFFGLINEMYFFTQDVVDEDFILRTEGEDPILDTRKLNTMAAHWLTVLDDKLKRSHGERMLKCIERACSTYEWALGHGRRPETDYRIAWSTYGIVWHVKHVVTADTGLRGGSIIDSLIGERELNYLKTLRGVCSARIVQLREKAAPKGADFLYYVSLLPGFENHANDPETCESRVCMKHIVNDSDYRTKHHECEGQCRTLAVDRRRVQAILIQGHVPAVRISQASGNSDLQVEIVECTKPHSWVAISHVWSHGLGNATDNALPECQMRRLMKMFEDLQVAHAMPPVFWMDTLCCPVSPKESRNLAISLMPKIYRESCAALVLDSTLLRLETGSLDELEKLVYACISPWNDRLWTLQESYLPPRLYFQFRDRAVDLAASLRQVLAIPGKWQTPIVWSIVNNHLQTRGYKALDWLKDFPEVPRDFDRRQSGEGDLLTFFGTDLRRRATTVVGDEASCLATLCEFDQFKIRSIVDIKRDDAQGRMCKFWELHPNIPAAMIFSTGPKLDVDGFRWAPSTLLHANDAASRVIRKTPSTRITASGLELSASAYILTVPPILGFWPGHSAYDEEVGRRFFIFQDQWGAWFLVKRTLGVSDTWWHSDTPTKIALVMMEDSGITVIDEEEDIVLPDPDRGLAALCLIHEGEEEFGTSHAVDGTTGTSKEPTAKVLAIGGAMVSEVADERWKELEFIGEKYRKEKWSKDDIFLRRDEMRFRSTGGDNHLYTCLRMFHDIQAKSVSNRTWCFV